METREIFDAAPQSVSEFLSDIGQGLYIPPYQRSYSWDRVKVSRLLEDVTHGLNQLFQANDSICFLGTVIGLRDTTYATVEPRNRAMVPTRVMTIIDGQQRLTTLLLLTTVLHEEIRLAAGRLRKTQDQAAVWASNQAVDVTARLALTYEEDMRYGEGNFRYYPRLIRAFYDLWSRQADEAQYTSPIGHYLHCYGNHVRSEDSTKQFQHEPFRGSVGSDEKNNEAHRHLTTMRAHLRTRVRRLARADDSEGDSEEEGLPHVSDIISSEAVALSIFNSPLPEEVKVSLQQDSGVASVVRLCMLANYLLSRVTVAVVTSKREEYGFDMFEALNTTGEPLTAIETFKPRAIQAESLEHWKMSPSKASFDIIDAHLDKLGATSTDRRQSATSALLTPFALVQDGVKLGKRLNEQRKYLRTRYEDAGELTEQRIFLETLEQVVKFIDGPWENSVVPGLDEHERRCEEALFSLAVLKDSNHDIVIAPLARYYAAYRLATRDDVERRLGEFLQACRACVAFYGLWRGAFGSTKGIDDIYRKLMSGDHKVPGVAALARRDGSIHNVLPVSKLKLYLRWQLEDKSLETREKWTRAAAETAVFTASRPLTRLLLLAASHNSALDEAEPGLLVNGRAGLLEMLTRRHWRNLDLLTVEHVAPQKREGDGWEEELYAGATTINRLGNLTLLPSVENSSVSNRSWPLKRLMFQALSAQTVDESERSLAAARSQGVELGASTETILRDAQYLPLLAALGRRESAWDLDFVGRRSVRLAELAWNALYPWLEESEA